MHALMLSLFFSATRFAAYPTTTSFSSRFDPFQSISPNTNASLPFTFPSGLASTLTPHPTPSSLYPVNNSSSSLPAYPIPPSSLPSNPFPSSYSSGNEATPDVAALSLGEEHGSSEMEGFDMFAQTRSLYEQHLGSVNAYTMPHDVHSSLAKTVFTSPQGVDNSTSSEAAVLPIQSSDASASLILVGS